MKRFLREIRRAPGRILASAFALALAVGAIGVLAIPTVATSSLRDAAERDRMGHVFVGTSDSGAIDVASLTASLDNVERAETQIDTRVVVPNGPDWVVVGSDVEGAEVDRLNVESGRLPTGPNEFLVPPAVAKLGDSFDVLTHSLRRVELTVVGHGSTSAWSGDGVLFTNLDTARGLAGIEGTNRVVFRGDDDSDAALRTTTDELRGALAAEGITFTDFPWTVPDGQHPIEADIEQVSTMIGLLGLVAGAVALVLLGSTTNTLITERTREVAIMRALGSPGRPLRRRLRRLALGIAVAAVVIGLPLGVLISNVIARMVLEEFVGLTPDIAVSIPVMIGSALFALIGARLVAARAARRVAGRPLAEALRDRDGAPFGRRFTDRGLARIPTGNLLDRTAVRNGWHRRSRSIAVVAQIGAAVAALLIVASMATTVNDFNAAQYDHINWASRTTVVGTGLDIPRDTADRDPRSEVAIDVLGAVEGWELDVYGYESGSAMIDPVTTSGTWFDGGREAVVSAGFAERTGIDVGDDIAVTLASGEFTYEVTGLHPDRERAVYTTVDTLAIDLGSPDMANIVLSLDEQPRVRLDALATTGLLANDSADEEGRDAIVLIFGSIGAVVVAVAGLAVASGLAVNVYERRHEFAALRAIGGRRRHVYRSVAAELLPQALLGVAIGVAAGYVGSLFIVDSFEASNAVEIGLRYATGAIPAALVTVVIGSIVLAGLAVRRATRRPIAVTLRGA